MKKNLRRRKKVKQGFEILLWLQLSLLRLKQRNIGTGDKCLGIPLLVRSSPVNEVETSEGQIWSTILFQQIFENQNREEEEPHPHKAIMEVHSYNGRCQRGAFGICLLTKSSTIFSALGQLLE
ncbi:hypothetical protein HHK36_032527 [Tetracentron sinense]|uniref:Uncharacterized protein n=1 Tax=Tetracentron sinense TaxID=13715 RepID=A0A834Y782_TETSI|nr:hypothetical protein HHK36_032527 [Tetracentron sinense]